MKRTRNAVVLLTCWSILAAHTPVWARPLYLFGRGNPPPPPAIASDVALGPVGELRGKIVDSYGNGLPNQEVALEGPDGSVTRVLTDRDGYFLVNGAPPGVYHISSSYAHSLYRVWATGTAPPIAVNRVHLVVPDTNLTGRNGEFWSPGRMLIMLGLIGGLVAVGVHESDDDDEDVPVSP